MNEQFLKRMQAYLKDEYPNYLATLQEERYRGIRVNTLKMDVDTFQKQFPYPLKESPFSEEGFYIDHTVASLGHHPWHISGTFYMQEPSASSAVTILDVKKNDWVLDLCAAPGGKSTQILAKLQHTGFLVSNEIDPKRAQILLSNMERFGAGEYAVLNTHPKEIAKQCPEWFDKVLVDAPCSGEGMLKKHEEAMQQWSIENIEMCAKRQLQVLESAYAALKKGGILVYSTCTYAMEENEAVVAEFLRQHEDMIQIDCAVTFGRSGFPYDGMDETKVRRIFPMDHGEGHFIAKFQKQGTGKEAKIKYQKNKKESEIVTSALSNLLDLEAGYFQINNDQVFWRQQMFVDFGKLRVLRQGILLGEIIKKRFEPHHHAFLSAQLQTKWKQRVKLDEEQWQIYHTGNVLPIAGYRGYVACLYQGQIVGFGKGDGNVIKNKFPKGLRFL